MYERLKYILDHLSQFACVIRFSSFTFNLASQRERKEGEKVTSFLAEKTRSKRKCERERDGMI